MKNFFRIFENINRTRSVKVPLLIIAIVAVIGFSIMGCVVPDDNGSGGNNSGSGNDGGSSGNGTGNSGTDSGSNGSSSKTPGSTKENAISVTVGYSSSHTISSSGENWFKFTGTGDPIIFETKGNVVDTHMWIESWSDWWENNDGGEGSNALMSGDTTSGTTYTIKITAESGTSGSFTFVAE